MENKCNICGVTGDEAEFYKGLTSRCKECHKKKVRENRRANAEYYKKYDAERFQKDPKVRARHRRYQKTEAGKASMNRARKKWLEENPMRRAASTMVNNAVRDGKLLKPDKCSECGASGRIDGHHEDYNKPLDVKWLCRSCHVKAHDQFKTKTYKDHGE